MSESASIIELSKVSFSYGDIPVLKNVDLALAEKEAVSIVGPNGGGKTTLLKLILGLLEPDTGSVSVFGKKPELGRERIGYMPQYLQFDPLFPATVLDIVLMGRLNKVRFGPYRKEDKAAAHQALDEVRLADLGKRHFSSLSGGQRQRVLIARALACHPELLILDEPTANVDMAVEEQLYALIKELNQRMAVIIVSHDTWVVSKVVQSVVCVSDHSVHAHPTSELTGELIQNLYGTDMQAIRHDHRCSEEGHHRHD